MKALRGEVFLVLVATFLCIKVAGEALVGGAGGEHGGKLSVRNRGPVRVSGCTTAVTQLCTILVC